MGNVGIQYGGHIGIQNGCHFRGFFSLLHILASGAIRDLIVASKPKYWGMGNTFLKLSRDL